MGKTPLKPSKSSTSRLKVTKRRSDVKKKIRRGTNSRSINRELARLQLNLCTPKKSGESNSNCEVTAELENKCMIKWKDIEVLGENVENINRLKYEEKWDFSHIDCCVQEMMGEYPNCDIYLFGGSPQNYLQSSLTPATCPNIVAIAIESTYEPPPFVSAQDFQHGGEEYKTIRQHKLYWERIDLDLYSQQEEHREFPGNGNVFALKSRLRKTVADKRSTDDLIAWEYLTLFIMKPSVDWVRKEDGKLKIGNTIFKYDIGNGDIVDELFDIDNGDTLREFIPDFCDRFDLEVEYHEANLKQVIRDAFASARKEKEKNIDMFSDYPSEVLDSIKTVKIFPQNDCVESKQKYINKYYGKADSIK